MNEDFLHYIWRTKQINFQNIKTVQGEPIKILNFGLHNANAGPDFLDARITVKNQTWAGHVEIHVKSSDWIKHNHEVDDAYKNVILHVVYENDVDIKYASGEIIPALEIKGFFNEFLYWRYEQLVQGKRFLACQNQLGNVDDFLKTAQYDKWLIERLQAKSQLVLYEFENGQRDWKETYYRIFCYALGLKVNADAFLSLAKNLPLKILEKHKSNLFQLEALLFGVAGLLDNDLNDDYFLSLKKEFNFLQIKYQLEPILKVQWKFSRMHPKGFPTIRIAQLAAIFNTTDLNFDDVIARGNLADMYELLKFKPSTYWQNHYTFGKVSEKLEKPLGKDMINRIIINAVAPMIFTYSIIKNEPFYKQRVLDLLDQLPKEANKITNSLEKLGFLNQSGYQSQALLQMYKAYCRPKNCLNCAIGNGLLKLDYGK